METRRLPTANGFSALPTGAVLDRYRIDSVIAAGGFGITYLCHHVTLGKPYALKEHFPRQFAYREGTTSEVRPTDPDTFTWALGRFIDEGRSLARCTHPNVVGVADVFEANSTAYMVLDYEQGQSLKAWLDELGRPPTQDEIDRLLMPLLDALEYVHGQGLLHRDIAPDNIVIRPDGSPCLIDFGAARQAVAERSQIMSAVVKSGYSPPEQYTRSGRAQGPWTDIYALGATLYRAVTEATPQEAPERQIGDDLRPVAELVTEPARYRPGFLTAIDHALTLRPAERPQTVAAWRDQLFAKPTPIRLGSSGTRLLETAPSTVATTVLTESGPAPARRNVHSLVMALLAIAALGIAALWWAGRTEDTASRSGSAVTSIPAGSSPALEAQKLVAEAETRRRADEERTRVASEQANAARLAAEAARAREEQEAAETARRRQAAEDVARAAEQQRAAAEEAARRREEQQRAAEAAAREQAEADARRAEDARLAARESERRKAEQPANPDETNPDAAALPTPPGAVPLAPPPPAATPAAPDAEFAKAMQAELKRLGCYGDEVDGDWGTISQRAFEDFLRRTKASTIAAAPTPDHLDAARKLTARVCPLVCGTDQRIVEGRCVDRVRVSPPPPKRAPPAPAAKADPAPAPKPAKKAQPNCGSWQACLSLYRQGRGEIHCPKPPGC
jgi:serine/threonine protein kinase